MNPSMGSMKLLMTRSWRHLDKIRDNLNRAVDDAGDDKDKVIGHG